MRAFLRRSSERLSRVERFSLPLSTANDTCIDILTEDLPFIELHNKNDNTVRV